MSQLIEHREVALMRGRYRRGRWIWRKLHGKPTAYVKMVPKPWQVAVWPLDTPLDLPEHIDLTINGGGPISRPALRVKAKHYR